MNGGSLGICEDVYAYRVNAGDRGFETIHRTFGSDQVLYKQFFPNPGQPQPK